MSVRLGRVVQHVMCSQLPSASNVHRIWVLTSEVGMFSWWVAEIDQDRSLRVAFNFQERPLISVIDHAAAACMCMRGSSQPNSQSNFHVRQPRVPIPSPVSYVFKGMGCRQGGAVSNMRQRRQPEEDAAEDPSRLAAAE